MDNRRSFIKSLLLAAVAPSILIAGASDRQKWKRTTQQLWVPNPDWKDAEYECAFIADERALKMFEKLPYYLAKNQVEYEVKHFAKMYKTFADHISWNGQIMQRV